MFKLVVPFLFAAAISAQEPYKIGEGVAAPVPVFKVEPQYTQEAKDAKLEGSILMSIVVDDAGQVTLAKVIQSRLVHRESGAKADNDLGLAKAAVDCVKQWKFRPGMKDGKPVPVRANVEINFRLI